MRRVPAADAKFSQVRCLSPFNYIQKLNFVNCRKQWMRLSCCPISHPKSVLASIDIVSPFIISDSVASRIEVHLLLSTDWAYLEDWCRRLTGTFSDVYVFTIPLYLPKLEPDGKWRVVSPIYYLAQKHVLPEKHIPLDSRSDWFPTERRRADSLCQSHPRFQAFFACYSGCT